ncbi:hypothetical protein OKW43_003725 [Paraburkholderia sp. WC7.3g]|uniref:hypothetical protein n=1 Tax=Paraburkholderia sp. WC7.3g TaxID=2991070 RepID=UPI003D1C117E
MTRRETDVLTKTQVRRFQAALAVEMCMRTGWRVGEALPMVNKLIAERLAHSQIETTMRYLSDSGRSGRERAKRREMFDAAELAPYITVGHSHQNAIVGRTREEPPSPYSRVYQDQGRVDALSAHLSALREQLED